MSFPEPDGREQLAATLADRLRAREKENLRHNAREILCLRAKIAHLGTQVAGCSVRANCDADAGEVARGGQQFRHLPHRSAIGASIVEGAVCHRAAVDASTDADRLQNEDIDICPQCRTDMKVHPTKGIMA